MRALLLAAGRGTRLGPLTTNCPKPMLPICGVPMVERILGGIAAQTGIHEFVLVTGYHAEVIQDYFGDGKEWDWWIQYAHQETPLGVGHAVNCARELLCDAPFLMTYGDIILSSENYAQIVSQYTSESSPLGRNLRQSRKEVGSSGGGGLKAIVTINCVDDPYQGAAVYLREDATLQSIHEKPPQGTAQTHWNNAGLFVFDPLLFDYTAKLTPSPRGEYELPDAITAMIADGYTVGSMELVGEWQDVGTPDAYVAINVEFARRAESPQGG